MHDHDLHLDLDLEEPDRIPPPASVVWLRVAAFFSGLILTLSILYLAVTHWGDPSVAPAMWLICFLTLLGGIFLMSLGISWSLTDKALVLCTLRDPNDKNPYRAPLGPPRDSDTR